MQTSKLLFYDSIENIVMGRTPTAPAAVGTGLNPWQKIRRVFGKINSPALTMCGDASVQFLKEAMDRILSDNIPGDFIETGVWRGGIPILMRAYLRERQDRSRLVWVADSFQGLPTGWHQIKNPKDRWASLLMKFVGQLAVSQNQVEDSFRTFGLLDQQVRFLPGWFHQSLPTLAPDQKFSLIRLDGDYYESTKDALTYLYPLLSIGGFIIIDDYNLPFGCKKAVDGYRQKWGINSQLITINSQSVYWRKENTDESLLPI